MYKALKKAELIPAIENTGRWIVSEKVTNSVGQPFRYGARPFRVPGKAHYYFSNLETLRQWAKNQGVMPKEKVAGRITIRTINL